MSILKNLRVKIKLTLPSSFLLLILLVATILISLNQVHYARSMKRLSFTIMEEVSDRVAQELFALKERSLYQLKLTSILIADNGVQIHPEEDKRDLNDAMVQLLSENRVITQVFYGSPMGDFYLITRDSSQGYVKRIHLMEESVSWELVYDSLGNYLKTSESDLYVNYDPRKRKWFSSVEKKLDVSQTKVYKFHQSGKMGFTYSMPVMNEERLAGVVGIDITIDSLSTFISQSKLKGDGFIFLFDKSGKGLAHSETTGFSEEGDSLLHSPSLALMNMYDSTESGAQFVSFKHNKIHYLSLVERYPTGALLAVVTPRSVVMGDVYQSNMILFFFSVAGVLFAVLAGFLISQRVTTPLAELQRQTELIKNFRLDTNKRINSRFLEIDLIGESFQSMQRGLASFRKFVPADLVRQIMSSGNEAALGGEERQMSIMFMDIAGFTTLSEQLNSDQLVNFISDFFQEMSVIIIEHGGTVDKYIGDCIMAFWNAPKTVNNHEELACETALACLARLRELQEDWRARGLPEISIRIGIHSDLVTVGNMGSKERLNYTVIGDGVNLASRLEGLGKIYGVPLIISETVAGRLPDSFHLRPLDWVVVKGKSAPVPIYTINREQCKSVADLHRGGYEHYVRQEWDEAQESFRKILSRDEDDVPANLFLARIASLKNNPPGENWDGIFHNKNK